MILRPLCCASLCAAFLGAGLTASALPASPTSQRTISRSTSSTLDTVSASDARSGTVVVLDPGHGGFDRGGIPGQRVAEKTMNLDVALRLRSILTAAGYRVVMTRDSDVFIPLGTRVAIANSYSNAIFVCIHFNSATRRGANGIETYFYSSQSLPLASAIHYNVAGSAPSENRGVRRRGYYVLRRTQIPAVLVECGFLTNPTEAEYAQSSAYRQKLAEAIAQGIRSRGSVARAGSAIGAVPLQPFIDQTHSHDPDLSKHKRSSKSRSSRSKSSKTAKKKSSSSDSSSSSGDSSSASRKKKSSAKQTED